LFPFFFLDLDECTTRLHDCHGEAKCINTDTERGFKCICPSGYTGDGTHCEGIQPTPVGTGMERRPLDVQNKIKVVQKRTSIF